MASNISNSPYEADQIDALYKRVLRAQNTGEKQDYEIKVDDVKVVPRNSDPSLFHTFETFISPSTKTVAILMYRGGTTSSDKFFFHLNGMANGSSLGNVTPVQSVEKWQEDKLKQFESEYVIKGLRDEISKLKKDNEDLQEEVDALNEECDRLKDGGNVTVAGVITALGQKFGVLPPEGNQALQGAPQQEPATFKRKGEQQKDQEEEEEVIAEGENFTLSKENAGCFRLLCDLKNRFNDEELSLLMQILDQLRNNKHALYSTNKHVHNFLKQRPKQDEKI